MRVHILAIMALLSLLAVSCRDRESRELKERLAAELQPSRTGKVLTKEDLAMYQEMELSLNMKYVNDISRTIDEEFERQLDEFDRNELGFFGSMGNMFRFIFWNREKWEDSWKVKSSRYFNSMDVEQALYEGYVAYSKDVASLRNTVKGNCELMAQEEFCVELPSQDIYLGDLRKHSRNNLVIELGVEAVIWLIVLAAVALLSLFFAVPTGGLSIIVTVLSIIVSIVLSLVNDHKMLSSLREQNTDSVCVEIAHILSELNKNTYEFYGL